MSRQLFLRSALVGLLSLGIGCTQGPAAPAAEPPVANAVADGQAWLTEQQIHDAKLALTTLGEREVQDVVATSGRVTFDDQRVSHVFSPVTGRVTQVLARLGQRVKKGDPLVVIESPDVGSAFSDLGKAQADVIAAEHDYQRQKELFEAHAGPQKDFEAAEDNYRKAKAELDRAEQKARLLRSGSVDRVTQEYTLRSSMAGEVMTRSVNPGAEVQGQYSGGNAVELFTIGELDQVWVMADLFEIDLARVQKGAEVEVSVVAYPGRTFTGTVDWISSTLDPATRTARVRCTLPNLDPEHPLKPEMYATASIKAPGKKALTVPRSALLHLGEQTVVFVQAGRSPDGKLRFERKVVRADEGAGPEEVPVLRGLKPGDVVVSSGAILLSET